MDNEITLHLSPVVMSTDEYKSLGYKINSSDAELCTLVDSLSAVCMFVGMWVGVCGVCMCQWVCD